MEHKLAKQRLIRYTGQIRLSALCIVIGTNGQELLGASQRSLVELDVSLVGF